MNNKRSISIRIPIIDIDNLWTLFIALFFRLRILSGKHCWTMSLLHFAVWFIFYFLFSFVLQPQNFYFTNSSGISLLFPLFFFSFWSHFLLHGINFFDVYCCTEVFLVAVVTRTCYEGGWGGGKGKSGKWEPEEGMRRTEEDKTEQLKKTLPVGLWAQESSSGVDE